jgi:hypothetical protein
MLADEVLFPKMAEDPDYSSNPQICKSVAQLRATLLRFGRRDEEIEECATFWGFTGELVGHLWKAALARDDSRQGLSHALTTLAQHAALSFDEQCALPFYSTAQVYFSRGLRVVAEPDWSPFVESTMAKCVKRAIEPAGGAQLAAEFGEWAKRASARYAVLYRELGGADGESAPVDEALFVTRLAACYCANARLLALSVDTWCAVQSN